MAYDFILYLHIASAMLLIGSSVASRAAERGLRTAPDVATLRGALDVVQRATRFNPALALVMLASGVWLGDAGVWSATWFWVAVATWCANLILAVRFVVPGHRSLGAAASQAADGPVPPRLDELRHARAQLFALDAMIGLDLGTLVLMVSRPESGSALLWPALGVMLVWAIRAAGNSRRYGCDAPASSGR